MPLLPGSRLGPYEIVSPLGAGGMGEVYRARDTRLERTVAIKVLPSALATDKERLKRFEKEARSASSLNHPNIVTIHEIGQADSVSYIAMELVEGPTLRELLSNGPLPAKRMLQIGAQVADGLAKAHTLGVVHRDLKPENVMVTADGFAKILDFGLAKLTEPDPGSGEPTRAPTVSAGTEPGVVMGTAAYMSPEQAVGKAVDFRSDQFSFGSVLYEMVTGRRAFQRASAPETLAAIIRDEPEPIEGRQPATPAILRWAIERCLSKDPKGRYASTEDLARELATMRDRLSELFTSGGPDLPSGPGGSSFRRTVKPLLTAALAATVAGLLFWSLRNRTPAESRTVARFSIDLPGLPAPTGKEDAELAISPDGTRLAFLVTGDERRINLRRVDELQMASLPGTEGATFPFFSPDGESLAFFSGGKLKKMSVTRGGSVDLCEVEVPKGGAWGRDGNIYFVPKPLSPIWRIPAGGGAAAPVTTLEKGELFHSSPETLPESPALLFTVATRGGLRIAAGLPGSKEKQFLTEGWAPRYVAGHLVFMRGESPKGTLFAAPFDVARLKLRAAPVPVMEGISVENQSADFGLSDTGTLLYYRYTPFIRESTLVRVDRSGSERRLTDSARAFYGPRLSPDGTRVAVGIGPEPTTTDVWVYEMARGTLTRLTHDGTSGWPVWTPDGTRLFFSSIRNGVVNVFSRRLESFEDPERLLESPFHQWPHSVSPDGAWLAFSEMNPKTRGDLWLFPLSGGAQRRLLVASPYYEWGSFFSPNGRWLAYSSDESGRFEIYVQGFPGPSARWQISTNGGVEPMWSLDGRELFYREGDKMVSVSIGNSGVFTAGAPKTLFEGKYSTGFPGQPDYSVLPGGDGFLMVKPVDPGIPVSRLVVVLNWVEELKRLTEPNRR